MSAQELSQVTPVVLTHNEEANIGRTLDSLGWAQKVVILDSGSIDATEQIARSFSNVGWHAKGFDNHRAQWEHAIRETGVTTEYVLALDADMQVPSQLVNEIRDVFLPGQFAGGMIAFDYQYSGNSLAGSLYPPQTRLFKIERVSIGQTDHTQSFSVDGPVYRFKRRLIHDDRKPLERWVAAQLAYQQLNELELLSGGRKRLRDRLRSLGIMPPITGLLAYLAAGGPFKGAAAARYAYERVTAEALLAIKMMNLRLESKTKTDQPARETLGDAETRSSNKI